MNALAVIPARFASTRFPGKPLHIIAGKPLVRHVWERCREAKTLDEVVVATDDERIATVVRGFGGKVAMTRADHPSGTDRLAEVADQMPQYDLLINVQGDEPLISPEIINALVTTLKGDPALEMITAANEIAAESAADDPNIVKVVLDLRGDALYFSRSRLPFPRNPGPPCLRHQGIYGYRRELLRRFVAWPPSVLEKTEGLEQLRALENGARIRVIITGHNSPGVDTPEQAEAVERLMRSARE